jgi:hypothetical protein
VIVVVVVAAVLVIVPLELGHTSSSPSPAPPRYPTLGASLGGVNGSAVPLTPSLLGVNLRADVAFPPASQAALNSTGVRFARWPGGGDGDRLDPLADDDRGLIYNDSGVAAPANTTFAQFVDWCRSVACQSIVTLPGEVDNASNALAIVNYSERSLDFRPTYWEIGNEPALWTHFGIPWNQWSKAQTLSPTPVGYAQLVQQYVRAIHTVDPTTGIIGIAGIGPSSVSQSTWITDTVEVNGPNLSAIAIHVYPAGPGYPPNDTIDWFSTLHGHSALPYRVPNALLTVASACATCHISLLVDEFQTGTLLTSANSLSGGYLAAYIGAELVQVLPLPLASLDYYDFQSNTPGAWLDQKGTASASFDLYQALLSDFGDYGQQLNVTSSGGGLLVAEGGTSATSLGNLLLVNTNATYAFRVNLAQEFPGAARGSAWVFDGASSAPTTQNMDASTAGNWTIPPASLVIFSGIGPASLGEPRTPTDPVEETGSARAAAETSGSGFFDPAAAPIRPRGFLVD